MIKFATVIVAIAATVFNAQAQKNSPPPGVEIIIISPSQELCMGAQKTAIETLSKRQKGKEAWSEEEVKKYLGSELPKTKSEDIARISGPISQAINDTIQVMVSRPTVEQASGRLAFITDFCTRALKGKRGSSI
jgi:hypothetical protein